MDVKGELGESLINALAKMLLPEILPQVVDSFDSDDDLLTVQQLNDQYYHINHDQMARVVVQRGFPSVVIPGRKKPKYSRRAVEKFIADHQDYHI